MIWSLLKVLLFVAAIAGLTYGAGILMDTGGGIRIAMLGMEYNLGPLQAAVALVVLMLALWLLLKLIGLLVAVLRFLNGDETAISRYFDRNRERKGYQALSDGLMALASGEGRVALSRAAKADKLLDRPELTTLLIAQAAEMTGDTKRASEAYKQLLEDDKSRFVGIRGLMRQKMIEGDTETALKLAEKAFALKPKHSEIQETLLGLQTEHGDWKGARVTLGAKLKSGDLPRDIFRRRDAVLALQEAKGVFDEDASIEAREAAIEANRLSPDLIPAAAMAARSYIAKGDSRNATKVLKKAWSAQPHPDLAAAFAEIAPDESVAARLKRFRTLTGINPDHIETRLLLAELNITAEDFPAARRALGDLATSHPNARTLAIMAAVERGEGADDAVIRGWLARALTAPRGPQWCCDKCQAIHAQWVPVCDNCASFDTLSWREPADATGPSATGSELLPLIIGAPEPASVTVDAEPEPDDAEIISDTPEEKTEK
ncbi:heme biosynthesis protein HemY [Pseudorhodobacter sp. E13]|uniref:heme biosynthesis protein HemY n=1 Tax=Pseudorhodobacter sp. E13 TaxID=2487931 RepID=UPI000F8D5F03|nr:heme biosynthesis HemY N-terminal domain-containing protein [Pseudorhodobacter sp. E13]RUS59546.1 heme biosynthesis protein HemY [Pseudorhodobacter sp. E13]